MRLRLIGAVLLAAGALTVPTAAHAAEAGSGLVPLVERDAAGKTVLYPAHPGETVPVVLGVKNTGSAALTSIVVNVRVFDDLDLPKEFTNCQYYTDANLHGAWCSIDAEVAAGATYKLEPFRVSVSATATKAYSIVFQWATPAWADAQGGITALAKAGAGRGTSPAAGAGGTLSLATTDLPVPANPEGVGFAGLKLITPPTTQPATKPTTTAPTAVPTATSTAAPGSPAPASSSAPAAGPAAADGGLPVTGSKTAAIAGLGVLLLLGGAVGVLLVRRRRTRFVA